MALAQRSTLTGESRKAGHRSFGKDTESLGERAVKDKKFLKVAWGDC